jgi:hypothetical protein
VKGEGFPPNSQVALRWDRGITSGDEVLARADAAGTIEAAVLVFHNDRLGPRRLVARLVGYPDFPEIAADYLVVEGPGMPSGPSSSDDPDDTPIVSRR